MSNPWHFFLVLIFCSSPDIFSDPPHFPSTGVAHSKSTLFFLQKAYIYLATIERKCSCAVNLQQATAVHPVNLHCALPGQQLAVEIYTAQCSLCTVLHWLALQCTELYCTLVHYISHRIGQGLLLLFIACSSVHSYPPILALNLIAG